MRNHSNRLGDTTGNKFVCAEFGIGNDGIPFVCCIGQATDPVVGIHGGIAHELKFFLLVQVSNLVILLVDDPDIVDREDDVGLFSLYDFSNPLHAKRFRLVPVGRREHFVSVL